MHSADSVLERRPEAGGAITGTDTARIVEEAVFVPERLNAKRAFLN